MRATVRVVGDIDDEAYANAAAAALDGASLPTGTRFGQTVTVAGYPVVMSKAVAARLDQTLPLAPLGLHAVKGRAPIDIFGWRPDKPETLS